MSRTIELAPLPMPLTRFFGRRQEIDAVSMQLHPGQARLLTLVGPGGVGKTRLALQIAAEVQGRFADGALFVSLSAVRDPDLVLATLVLALGIEGDEGVSPAERLQTLLNQREMLLVLDNLEQIVAVGPALSAMLVSCPGLSMLVTSRLPLRVSGEQVFPVSPLALPDSRNGSGVDLAALVAVDAIALFVDRAAAALPHFSLTERNARDVIAICRRGDGLPLAIELAAARLRILSPGELAMRLERRLPLLAGGPRDQPDRLQSMRDAIAWSYDLLEPGQRALFRWLSVFVGGCGITAVEAMASALGVSAADVLDLLCGIVDASLMQRAEGLGGEARLTMLETIREYGLERLAVETEQEAARDAHASWCVAFAEAAGPNLAGPDHRAWWNRCEAELNNVRGAHAWLFAQHDAGRALRLGAALAWFWASAGYYGEGRALYRRLIEMPRANDFPVLLARALDAAGNLEHWLDNLAEAEALYRRRLTLSRDLADTAGVIRALRALGSIAIDRNEVAAADQLLIEGLTLSPLADADWDAAAIANLLGIVAFARGEYTVAAARGEEAVQGWQEIDDTGHVAAARVNWARARLALGDVRRAAEGLRRVLDVVEAEVGDDFVTSDCFEVAAGIALATYDVPEGARLLAAADVMLTRMGVLRRPPFQAFVEDLTADARIRLGDSAFAEAWHKGAELSTAAAIALARAVTDAARPGQSVAKANTVGIAALTAREREVLRLVASGRSDKEIALALGITRFTASNHVSNIRAKLDSPSRAAIAALAVREGLL